MYRLYRFIINTHNENINHFPNNNESACTGWIRSAVAQLGLNTKLTECRLKPPHKAFFFSTNAAGVADGVGQMEQFKEYGVDAAAYSDELMRLCAEYMHEQLSCVSSNCTGLLRSLLLHPYVTKLEEERTVMHYLYAACIARQHA